MRPVKEFEVRKLKTHRLRLFSEEYPSPHARATFKERTSRRNSNRASTRAREWITTLDPILEKAGGFIGQDKTFAKDGFCHQCNPAIDLGIQ